MGGSSAGSTFADRVAARLNGWPGVTSGRAHCGIGAALTVGARQIVHLHSPDEAELCLTRPVIERLGDALAASGRVVDPGGDWIRIHLDTDSDVSLVVSLASVAIKAATETPPGVSGKWAPPCGMTADRRGAAAAHRLMPAEDRVRGRRSG